MKSSLKKCNSKIRVSRIVHKLKNIILNLIKMQIKFYLQRMAYTKRTSITESKSSQKTELIS